MKHIKNYEYILTIIIPVYNVENYLEKCVASVAQKRNKDVEIILVDDGSKDASGVICDKLKETAKIDTKVIHKDNGGLSSARNAGLEKASGKYIFFLDSDDYMVDGFVEKIIRHLKSDKYDVIQFKSCLKKKPGTAYPTLNEEEVELNSADCIKSILKNEVGNEICFKVFRSLLFKEIKFPIGRNYEDIAVCYKLLIKSKRILQIDSEYYIYNAYNYESITKKVDLKNMGDMYLSVNELCDGVINFCKTNGIDIDYIEYYKRHLYIYICLKLYKGGYNDSALMKDIISYLRRHNKYDLRKFKSYDLKRWAVFEILLLLHML